jgi:hypothetical protein
LHGKVRVKIEVILNHGWQMMCKLGGTLVIENQYRWWPKYPFDKPIWIIEVVGDSFFLEQSDGTSRQGPFKVVSMEKVLKRRRLWDD